MGKITNHDKYFVRTKEELLDVVKHSSDILNKIPTSPETSEENLKNIFYKVVKALEQPELTNFEAEHLTDAFLHICNAYYQERISRLDLLVKNTAFATVVDEARRGLSHDDNAIKNYSDLLRGKELPNGDVYLYPIYLTGEADYEYNPEYECSIKGARLLKSAVGELELFDKLLGRK